MNMTKDTEIEIDYDDEVGIINFWDRGFQIVLGKEEMRNLINKLVEALSI